jgi:catechol 2,3-dioxygenase-like lactoylglutathione lyase family enzyme
MVTRIGHIALRVRDLDAAVDFQRSVFGLVETDRVAGTSYLTCNDRHHELMLIADPSRRGYDHIALEVADRAALEAAPARVSAAGGRVLGEIRDDEPGIDRALRVQGPGGHVFKLFCGMERVAPPPPGDRPSKFEHVSVKMRHLRGLERFLRDGLGFRFSDRMGPLASWWHCDADHHGMAITWGPRPELSHYAYAWDDFAALGRVADRLREHRDRRCVWGPSRHGPGNNHFLYLLDEDGAMVESCSELAQMPPTGDYVARKWPWGPGTINQWGGPPPPAFLLAGYPIAAHAS